MKLKVGRDGEAFYFLFSPISFLFCFVASGIRIGVFLLSLLPHGLAKWPECRLSLSFFRSQCRWEKGAKPLKDLIRSTVAFALFFTFSFLAEIVCSFSSRVCFCICFCFFFYESFSTPRSFLRPRAIDATRAVQYFVEIFTTLTSSLLDKSAEECQWEMFFSLFIFFLFFSVCFSFIIFFLSNRIREKSGKEAIPPPKIKKRNTKNE